MKIKMKDYRVSSVPYKFYGVILDDDEIETLVTHDPSTVKSWINNVESLNQCRLHRLIVGLDVEWSPNFMPDCDHSVATLQLCVGQSCLVFQICHASRIPRRLREFLEDPDYTFVGVGIRHDVKKLRRDHGLEVTNTRDLGRWAADELDRKELSRAGLKVLVKEVFGEEMDKPKNATLSRWDNRHLTEGQVVYACVDAYFSFEIGRALSAWY